MENNQNGFNVLTQYIKDLSFENPKAPGSLSVQGQGDINVAVNVDVNQAKDTVFEVVLSVTVKAGTAEENIFMLEIKYGGLFNIPAMEKDELERVLLIHCPNILFPYARRIISDTTRDGGYSPLMLNPVDFMGLYLKKKESEAGAEKAPASEVKN